MYTDLMLDLETLGPTPGSVVLSIGAVAFDADRNSNLVEFERSIDPEDSQRYGLTINAGTVVWWSKQDAKAREMAFSSEADLLSAVEQFVSFVQTHFDDFLRVWGHGAAFDPPILEAAIRATGIRVPWHYRSPRDTRTLFDIAGIDLTTLPFDGVKHRALDDARHAARCVQEAMRRVRPKSEDR